MYESGDEKAQTRAAFLQTARLPIPSSEQLNLPCRTAR
jgi:hypothetical protein